MLSRDCLRSRRVSAWRTVAVAWRERTAPSKRLQSRRPPGTRPHGPGGSDHVHGIRRQHLALPARRGGFRSRVARLGSRGPGWLKKAADARVHVSGQLRRDPVHQRQSGRVSGAWVWRGRTLCRFRGHGDAPVPPGRGHEGRARRQRTPAAAQRRQGAGDPYRWARPARHRGGREPPPAGSAEKNTGPLVRQSVSRSRIHPASPHAHGFAATGTAVKVPVAPTGFTSMVPLSSLATGAEYTTVSGCPS